MSKVYTGVVKATMMQICKVMCPKGRCSLVKETRVYTHENKWAKQNVIGSTREKLFKVLEEHRGQRQ